MISLLRCSDVTHSCFLFLLRRYRTMFSILNDFANLRIVLRLIVVVPERSLQKKKRVFTLECKCACICMYSLVQWNWLSAAAVTGCTWVTCIQWRQRTDFTAPGCREKHSSLVQHNFCSTPPPPPQGSPPPPRVELRRGVMSKWRAPMIFFLSLCSFDRICIPLSWKVSEVIILFFN